MADVFISYERQSQPVAKRLADRLTAAGFEVWWDEQIPAHRAYAEVIEERLRAAGCVIVLWSSAAVKSQWVRAEADIARAEGKLVQAVVDDCVPPIPFDQLQHADLRGWTGALGRPGWRKIEASVRALTQAAPTRPAQTPASRAAAIPTRLKPWQMGAAALAVVAIAAAGWWFGLRPQARGPAAAAPRVAVLPITASDPALAPLAASIQDAMVTHLNGAGLTPLSGNTAVGAKAALVVDGRLQPDGNQIRVALRVISGEDQVTLWSGSYLRPSAATTALADEMASKATDIVVCGVATFEPGGRLSNADRSLFLRSCDLHHADRADETADALRQLTKNAPDFAVGQADLAMADVLSIPRMPTEQASAIRTEASAAADRAIKDDPHVGDAYVAKALLVRPPNNWLDRERWLRKGLAAGGGANLMAFTADLLMEVGRRKEGLIFSRRASALDPNSPAKTGVLIMRMAENGDITGAQERLAQAQAVWPNQLQGAAFSLAAFTDPAGSLRIVEAPGARTLPLNDQDIAAWRLLVQAEQTRTPAAAARAAVAIDQSLASDGMDESLAIRALLSLGHTEEVARYFRLQVAAGRAFDASSLFSAQGAALRRDPAFMTLAHDIGLTNYWRASGMWPDFCADPGLPYKCQDLAR